MPDRNKELTIRRRLVDALHADLVGPFVPPDHPSGGEEILPLAPSRWYLTGFLAPQGARMPDVDDQCYRSPWTPDVAPFSFTQREGFGGGGTSMSIAGFSPGSVVVG